MTGGVLAYASPPAGHVYPAVPTLLELQRRRHRVTVRTGTRHVDRLRAAGLDASPIDASIERLPVDDWRARGSLAAIGRLLRIFEARAALEVPDLRAAIARDRPEALLIDINCLGAMMVAECSGLPWAVYCPHPPALRSRDAPPFGPGLAPGGPLSAIRDAFVGRRSDRIWNAGLERLNTIRAELGLAPVGHLHAQQYLRAACVICFTAEPFEYPRRDWPASFRLVGPALWEPPSQEPPWLAAETRPIVLVTASTAYQGDERLIATALEALAAEPLLVVATTAAHHPRSFDPPANARVEPFLAHGPLLRRTACVISHGGMGTTQKALAAGVPVCAVPFARDQREVARRVQRCEAGVMLERRRLSATALRRAVHAAMSRAPGARRIAAAFAGAGGPAAAADAVQEILAAHRSRVPRTL